MRAKKYLSRQDTWQRRRCEHSGHRAAPNVSNLSRARTCFPSCGAVATIGQRGLLDDCLWHVPKYTPYLCVLLTYHGARRHRLLSLRAPVWRQADRLKANAHGHTHCAALRSGDAQRTASAIANRMALGMHSTCCLSDPAPPLFAVHARQDGAL